ncbi:MAG: sigma-54 factor interaction domain-containing protein, partial [Planctomycetes bacterium]|nr:sigma-54 factor interaction domain-containing protein [Planctomycetota bacterium]
KIHGPTVRRIIKREIIPHISGGGRIPKSWLLIGPTGAGKEVLAKAIHEVIGVGSFMGVNLAALSPEVCESELFGHVKGAYTGAVANRGGYFGEFTGKGGVFLLDEIGDFADYLQAKLLRTLEERTFVAMGSNEQKKLDDGLVIIAATNRPWNVRPDLRARFEVEIHIPPLAERLCDIPALVAAFVTEWNNGKGTDERGEGENANSWPKIQAVHLAYIRMLVATVVYGDKLLSLASLDTEEEGVSDEDKEKKPGKDDAYSPAAANVRWLRHRVFEDCDRLVTALDWMREEINKPKEAMLWKLSRGGEVLIPSHAGSAALGGICVLMREGKTYLEIPVYEEMCTYHEMKLPEVGSLPSVATLDSLSTFLSKHVKQEADGEKERGEEAQGPPAPSFLKYKIEMRGIRVPLLPIPISKNPWLERVVELVPTVTGPGEVSLEKMLETDEGYNFMDKDHAALMRSLDPHPAQLLIGQLGLSLTLAYMLSTKRFPKRKEVLDAIDRFYLTMLDGLASTRKEQAAIAGDPESTLRNRRQKLGMGKRR